MRTLILLAIADLAVAFFLLLLLALFVWRKMPQGVKHKGFPTWEWSHYYAKFRADTYLWWRGKAKDLKAWETEDVAGGDMTEEQVFERPRFRRALAYIRSLLRFP